MTTTKCMWHHNYRGTKLVIFKYSISKYAQFERCFKFITCINPRKSNDFILRYEQVSASIDSRYGHHTEDVGFNNDIIGLHVTNIDESYKPDKIKSTKPKPAIRDYEDTKQSVQQNVPTVQE